MDGIVYVNGAYMDASQARVSIFDRGFLFADGVYEVTAVLRGKLIDNDAHLTRLDRSLSLLDIRLTVSDAEIVAIQQQLIRENEVDEGTVYLQVTRGPALRDFAFPENPVPTLVAFARSRALIENEAARYGIRVVTVPDIRWRRRDIKTVGLLAASMAKQTAVAQGADDAWMVEGDFITEGSSSNAWIINDEGQIVTHHLSNEILAGTVRAAVARIARQHDMDVIEKPFTVEQALRAREAFATSSSTFVCPVIRINGRSIGDGRPGPVAKKLRERYVEMALPERSA